MRKLTLLQIIDHHRAHELAYRGMGIETTETAHFSFGRGDQVNLECHANCRACGRAIASVVSTIVRTTGAHPVVTMQGNLRLTTRSD